MGLPTEYSVFKGSQEGKVVKAVSKGKTELAPNDVAMRITHSGVCGTDLHHIHKDMVLGHEGIGVVEAVGNKVTKFKPGDRVGFGYIRDGCGTCKHCKAGNLWYCTVAPRHYATQDFDQGSFASYAVWPDTNLHKIPDNIDSAEAAPFMCAGMTVFVPMRNLGVKAGDRVGIIGVGGVGHLAIAFAAKLDAEVVVFSSSDEKRSDAEKLGASEFYVTNDLASKGPEKKLDYLLWTATSLPDWPTFFNLMGPRSHIVLIGLQTDDVVLPFQPLMGKEITVHGSLFSTPDELEDTLAFASQHDIHPIIEKFPMNEAGVGQAIGRIASGKVRYRGVLVA
ncbi:GroES-like protein [Rhizodiscina lignyota]|uniref:GroES-like protein n=1 Tax=Rhizodiscina lignyota TaxID=1504668 RepID=A0A9P4IUM8_9PEZI|nr:GroES-like protein [Rhizodiscina lignyota]